MVSLKISHDGYYASETSSSYGVGKRNVDGSEYPGRPTTRTVVLKEIKKPIAMSGVSRRKDFKIPAVDEWLGFDLMGCEFTAPYGPDHSKDVLRFSIQDKALNDYRATMEVSFINNPCAGVYVVSKDDFSEMKSVYEANTNEIFVTSLVYSYLRQPKKPTIEKQLDGHSYLIFRTRTKVDDKGKLISAHYGKIYGPWEFVGPGGM